MALVLHPKERHLIYVSKKSEECTTVCGWALPAPWGAWSRVQMKEDENKVLLENTTLNWGSPSGELIGPVFETRSKMKIKVLINSKEWVNPYKTKTDIVGNIQCWTFGVLVKILAIPVFFSPFTCR